MIKYKNGNIFDEDVEAIVNTVNCVGVMGRGLALQYKKTFPDNFKAYLIACKNGEVIPGKMYVYNTGQIFNPKYIINFPTKRHWKAKSKIEDISNGLDDLVRVIREYNIKSIAIPPLGSGLGGLNWKDVKDLINQRLSHIDCNIIVFEPLEQKIEKNISKKIPTMTAGRAALVGLIDNYLKGMLAPFISLLEIHKLMYFMQESGEVLKLNYRKAQYGPYAQNLRHVMNVIEGYYIKGYEDGGDIPTKQIELLPKATKEANDFLKNQYITKENFIKVSKLVEGFETPYGVELLATVHWVYKYENARTKDEIKKHIYSWNDRKKQFTEKQIEIAIKTLIKNNFIDIKRVKIESM